MADAYTNYTTQLSTVVTAINAADWQSARIQLAIAKVYLAALPISSLTGQQATEFRKLPDLDSISTAIDEAQIATLSDGGGTGLGLAQTAGVY